MKILILLSLFLIGCDVVYGKVPEDQAILAIIGEAEDQGPEGMLAVACAIRNRDSLKGVYGVTSPRVKKHLYSHGVYLSAKKAWKESASVDCTHGATHWENTKAFGEPYWVKDMVLTYKCNDHSFYRRR